MAENKDSTTKILQNMLDRSYSQGGIDTCDSLVEGFNKLKSLGIKNLELDEVINAIEVLKKKLGGNG